MMKKAVGCLKKIFLIGLPAFLASSCDMKFSSSLQESLDEDLTTAFTFYAFAPEDDADTESVRKLYRIGDSLDFSDLPSEEMSALRTGYDLLGWQYYCNSGSGSTVLPDSCRVDENNLVTAVTVTPSPASFVAVWKGAYDDYGIFSLSLVSGDISLANSVSGSTLTVTADEGYESYSWYIDGEPASGWAAASASGNRLTIDGSQLTAGYVYQVTVTAEKGGIAYSSQLQVEVTG